MDTFDIRKYITEGKVQNRIDSLLAYYEAETGEEADEDTKYEIEYMVSRGSNDDQIKSNILSEEKDVIEPDQDAVDAEEESTPEEEWEFDKENAERILPQAEKIIAQNIVDAYNREDGKRPQTSKRLILSLIKNKKESDYMNNYLPEFDMESPEKAVRVVLGTTFSEYLRSKVDSGSISSAEDALTFIEDLSDIFYPNFPTGKINSGLKNYIKNVSGK